VLETAARLFKVEFRRVLTGSMAPGRSGLRGLRRRPKCGPLLSRYAPREGKDKWFSAAPVVTGVRGRALPEAALICNFPGGEEGDLGLLQYSECGDVFSRVWTPDACHFGRTDRVGRPVGILRRGRLHRGAGRRCWRILPRRKTFAGFCETLPDGRNAPLGTIRKMKLAGSVWARRLGSFASSTTTTLSLDLHDREPGGTGPGQHFGSSSTRACNPGPGWKATVCTRALAT